MYEELLGLRDNYMADLWKINNFLQEKEEIFLFLKDGTEIDDDEYFEDLEDQVIIYVSNSPTLILQSTAGKGY